MRTYIHLLIILFLCGCTGKTKAENKPAEAPDSLRRAKAGDAFELAQTLLSSFKTDPGAYVSEMNYPDYYGGCYITPEGELIVLVKEGSGVSREAIEKIMHSGNFRLKTCRYAEKELLAVLDQINKFMQANYQDHPVARNVSTVRLETIDNCISVHLSEYNEEEIRKFKTTVIDSPLVRFEKSTGVFRLD